MSLPAFHRPGRQPPSADVRTPKTAELLTRRLRRMIVDGDLRDGDCLPREAELMAHFGVSRPTLREAVRVLEAESLIEVRRGSRTGAKVRVPGPEVVARPAGLVLQVGGATIADVLTARLGVEPLAAWLLADRDSAEANDALADALERAKAAAEVGGAGWGRGAADFHAAVVALCGNRALVVMAGMLHEIISRHMAAATRVHHEIDPDSQQVAVRKALRAYEKLLRLVRAGDADEADRFWRRHLEVANQALVHGFESSAIIDILE